MNTQIKVYLGHSCVKAITAKGIRTVSYSVYHRYNHWFSVDAITWVEYCDLLTMPYSTPKP